MNTKRILALVTIVLSVLFLLGLVVSTIGIWLLKAPLINLTNSIFHPTQQLLTVADGRLEQVDLRLGQAQDRLQTAETNITQFGDDLEQNSLILTAISQTVGAELTPIVTGIREDAAAVRELVEAANETVQNFNNLPFVSAEIPGAAALQNLVDSIAEAEAALQALRTNLQAARVERIQQAVERLTQPLQRLQTGLGEALAAVGQTRERIALTQARLLAIHEQILFWLNLTPWIFTLIFFWLAWGQVALIRGAYAQYRGTNSPEPMKLDQPVDQPLAGEESDDSAKAISPLEAAVIQTETDHEPQAEATIEPLSESASTPMLSSDSDTNLPLETDVVQEMVESQESDVLIEADVLSERVESEETEEEALTDNPEEDDDLH